MGIGWSRTAATEAPEPEPVPPAGRQGRRGGVSAEPVSDEDSFQAPFYPKTDEQKARIERAVEHSFLFANLDPQQREKLFGAMEELSVSSGVNVVTQGEQGQYFYVIESGSFLVFKQGEGDAQPKQVFQYEGSGSFGELALMYQSPRAATVQACTDAVLWRLDRESFIHIIVLSQRKKKQLYERFLSQVPLLKSLSPADISLVADCLSSLVCKRGEKIVTQGQPGDKFYLVESGTCEAQQEHKGRPFKVGEMGQGDYFGERALITNEPRACTVVVSSDSARILALDRASFVRLLGPVKRVMGSQLKGYKSAEQISAEGAGSR